MRTYGQAKEFAQQQHRSGSASWHNMCQMFSRQCVGAPPFGSSAREAFNRIPAEQRHTSSPPPAGSIAYYGFRDHGSGHAVFAVNGGFVWSNDILRTRPHRPGPVGRLPRAGGGCPTAAGSRPAPAASCRCRTRTRHRRTGRAVGSTAAGCGFAQDDSDSVWNLQVALARARLRVRERTDGLLRRAHPPRRRGLPASARLDGQRRRRHRRAGDDGRLGLRLGRRVTDVAATDPPDAAHDLEELRGVGPRLARRPARGARVHRAVRGAAGRRVGQPARLGAGPVLRPGAGGAGAGVLSRPCWSPVRRGRSTAARGTPPSPPPTSCGTPATGCAPASR